MKKIYPITRSIIYLGIIIALFNNTVSAEDKDMVLISAGSFMMGDQVARVKEGAEYLAHKIYLDAYYIDRHEVTFQEYVICAKKKACPEIVSPISALSIEKYLSIVGPKDPFDGANWYDASRYCAWVGKRLPTEAEWEKAARGKNQYLNPWGNKKVKKGDAAIEVGGPYPVGNFKKDVSPYGVFDMAGNLMEWVDDWYSKDYYSLSPAKNPSGAAKGKEKVLRGGNWRTRINGELESTAYLAVRRFSATPDTSIGTIGFRCARSK